jgi:tellurite resistance protein TehA-like permease
MPDVVRDGIASAFWILASLLLLGLVVLSTARIVRERGITRGDAATMQAWGAPPMACFTVASGLMLIAPRLLPPAFCVPAAQTLFAVGVIGSLISAFIVPLQLMTEHDLSLDRITGTFLLPVVPPIVAPVPLTLLLPTWPPGVRSSMLAFGYALLGVGLLLAALVIAVFFLRLLMHRVPKAAAVSAMWLVIGPCGQSIAGIVALGAAAQTIWPALAPSLAAVALGYGVLMWGFAMYWVALAVTVSLRAWRAGVGFALGWWALTFPVGVFTAGTVALYHITGSALYDVAAIALLGLLAAAWTLVATQTLRAVGSVGADLAAGGDGQRGSAAEHPVAGIA